MYQAFQDKITSCFDELGNLGINCERDWTCCTTCGHTEMKELCDDGEDYVFYHLQDAEDLRQGGNVVYLKHNISDSIRQDVIEIVKRYGSDWDGNDKQSIKIPFT